MSKDIDLEEIKTLVQECVKNNKIDFLSNLVFVLQNNYKDLAIICTDGNYHEGWSHSKVLDYVTYELN
jgi:hypothetical protein